MSIPVSKVVRVNILTSPTFPARKGFGLLLIAGVSARLALGERMRFYSDMDGVGVDFSSTDEEYKAAQVYFSQSPRPSELAIGRRFTSAAPGELLGATSAVKVIASWQAVVSGGFKISIDGVERSLTALNFSTDLTLNAVASRIQTALIAAGAAGASVTYDGTRFIVRSGTTGITSTVSYAIAPASGTDIKAMLALDAASGGKISVGIAAETIASSLDALQLFNASWYGLALTTEVTEQNVIDASAWVEARVKMHGVSTKAANNTDATSTTSLSYLLKAAAYRRTLVVYDDNDSYPAVSALARMFTVNFAEQNSTITLKFKQLPTITPTVITETQRLALEGNNANYYTLFGDSAMIAEGKMSSGVFADEVHGLDWFQNAIETNVFGYLYTRTTKVPQTDKGVAALVQKVEQACSEGVNNGLLAPGQWNGGPLGQINTGDFLPRGFYVYAQPVAEQNQSDREARKAPPIQVIAKGAGAIHSADITVTFER